MAVSFESANIDDLSTGKGKELWDSVLQQGMTDSGNNSQVDGQTVLVVGDVGNGKKSLMKRLQGMDLLDSDTGYALEYTYIDIATTSKTSTENEERMRVGFWLLEDPSYTSLMDIALNEKTVDTSAVVVTVDLSYPHNVIQSLQRWLDAIQDHLKEKIWPKLGIEREKELKERYREFWLNNMTTEDSENNESKLLPKGVLQVNLGIPIIIVPCKSDGLLKTAVRTCEEKFSLSNEYHAAPDSYHVQFMNFVAYSIRKLALKYGASLIYTSAMQNTNCDILLEYLVHQLLYRDEFRVQPDEKPRSVLLPAGSDHIDRIDNISVRDILPENAEKHTVSYDEMIIQPPDSAHPQHDRHEIFAKTEQAFLTEMKALRDQKMSVNARHRSPLHRAGSGTGAATQFRSSRARRNSLNADGSLEKAEEFFKNLKARIGSDKRKSSN
eukprot:gb/GECH01002995.1/.p1 GENE.gb/GECH01002995.1/~~gb/GECH01002995.1/.p1  ORF type:complete len:439 (+),score=96.32 gb/GECH01002995.1/:1-1317(+)